MSDDQKISEEKTDSAVIVRSREDIAEPPMYKVLLHNDNFTPMDFVVSILQNVFQKDPDTAQRIMLDVHHKGVGCCGVYPYEIAETKVAIVNQQAKQQNYPLKCSMETDDKL